MAQIATTIEQSKKLIELGIDVNTADMFYYKENIFNNALSVFNGQLLVRGNSELKDEDTIPAWSLSALIELMPAYLITNGKRTTNIQMRKLDDGNIGFYYFINQETNIIKGGINSIDAAFEMMCYLLKNKLIKF